LKKIQPSGTQDGKRQQLKQELLDGKSLFLFEIGRIADLGIVCLETGAKNDFQEKEDDDKDNEQSKHELIQQ